MRTQSLQTSDNALADDLRPARALWKEAFQQRTVWVRGAKLGLSVGVLQSIINQGDVWLAHSETAGTVVKTIVSPLVTFAVALVSAAATYVEKQQQL